MAVLPRSTPVPPPVVAQLPAIGILLLLLLPTVASVAVTATPTMRGPAAAAAAAAATHHHQPQRWQCPWQPHSQAALYAHKHNLGVTCHHGRHHTRLPTPGLSGAGDHVDGSSRNGTTNVIALLIRTHRPSQGQIDRAVAFAESCRSAAAGSRAGGTRITVWLSIDATQETGSPNDTVCSDLHF